MILLFLLFLLVPIVFYGKALIRSKHAQVLQILLFVYSITCVAHLRRLINDGLEISFYHLTAALLFSLTILILLKYVRPKNVIYAERDSRLVIRVWKFITVLAGIIVVYDATKLFVFGNGELVEWVAIRNSFYEGGTKIYTNDLAKFSRLFIRFSFIPILCLQVAQGFKKQRFNNVMIIASVSSLYIVNTVLLASRSNIIELIMALAYVRIISRNRRRIRLRSLVSSLLLILPLLVVFQSITQSRFDGYENLWHYGGHAIFTFGDLLSQDINHSLGKYAFSLFFDDFVVTDKLYNADFGTAFYTGLGSFYLDFGLGSVLIFLLLGVVLFTLRRGVSNAASSYMIGLFMFLFTYQFFFVLGDGYALDFIFFLLSFLIVNKYG